MGMKITVIVSIEKRGLLHIERIVRNSSFDEEIEKVKDEYGEPNEIERNKDINSVEMRYSGMVVYLNEDSS